MLLKRLAMLFIVLPLFLSVASSQNFKSGLAKLVSTSSEPSKYTVNYDPRTNDLIIAIISFTAQRVSSCTISTKTARQANFTCTANIQAVAYLFFEKTPMIYANTFSYYFLKRSTGAEQDYSVWRLQPGLTFAAKPQIRAFLTGFQAKEATINKIELKQAEDGWSIKISRSANIQIVSFSYLLIQNYSPYNLTFRSQEISKATNKLSLLSSNSNYLNFWGISSIKNSGSLGSAFGVAVAFSGGIATDSNIFSINSILISNNTSITGTFLIDNTNINTLSCGLMYYQPATNICTAQCLSNTYVWNTSIFSYKYCLDSLGENYQSMMNQTYIDSNLWEIDEYKQTGCATAILNADFQVVCTRCAPNYTMYNNQCVCEYGYYLNKGDCQPCGAHLCQLPVSSSAEISASPNQTLTIQLHLPINQSYSLGGQTQFIVEVTVNNLGYQGEVKVEDRTNTLIIRAYGIAEASRYDVKVSPNITDQAQLLLITVEQMSFLWAPETSLSLSGPVNAQAVLETVAPIFAATDKSVPVIMTIIFFLGDKINTLSLFQTVSLLYLINFIPIGQQYSSFLAAVSRIFIFQPRPIVQIAGSAGSWVHIPAINKDIIPYNQLIYRYTGGQLFLAIALNSLLSIAIQIGALVLLIKLGKNCLKQSKNRVAPYLSANAEHTLDLSRSQLAKDGKLKWLNEPQVRAGASFRYKLYVYFCKLDNKKWIGISSLWSMHVLSLSLLGLHQLTLPIVSFHALLSALACYFTLLLILAFPLLLLKYQPLYLLKSLSICYKRRRYRPCDLWIYYCLAYMEPVVYAVLVTCLESASSMLGIIITQMTLKIAMLKSIGKTIHIIKTAALGMFFVVALISSRMDQSHANRMITIMGCSLIMVILVELLKLLRGVIVLLLNAFKSKQEEPKLPKTLLNEIQSRRNPVLQFLQAKNCNKLPNSQETPHLTTKQQRQEAIPIGDLGDSGKQLRSPQPQYRSRAFRRRLTHLK